MIPLSPIRAASFIHINTAQDSIFSIKRSRNINLHLHLLLVPSLSLSAEVQINSKYPDYVTQRQACQVIRCTISPLNDLGVEALQRVSCYLSFSSPLWHLTRTCSTKKRQMRLINNNTDGEKRADVTDHVTSSEQPDLDWVLINFMHYLGKTVEYKGIWESIHQI